MIETIITLLIGLIAGVVVAWWALKNRTNTVDLKLPETALETDHHMVYRELEQMRKATTLLDRALRQPTSRGRWGELALRRVVELAGMINHCHFEEQVSLQNSRQ